jgi:hypothetical protein
MIFVLKLKLLFIGVKKRLEVFTAGAADQLDVAHAHNLPKGAHACHEQASASGPKSCSPQAAQTSVLSCERLGLRDGSETSGRTSIL